MKKWRVASPEASMVAFRFTSVSERWDIISFQNVEKLCKSQSQFVKDWK